MKIEFIAMTILPMTIFPAAFTKIIFWNKQSRFILSTVIGLLFAWFTATTPIGVETELKLLDIQFKLARHSRIPDSSVVILTIDQNSLQYFKSNGRVPWPWPRDFYAITNDFLSKAGAKAIVYDFHFNEPDLDRVASSGAENDSLFLESMRTSENVYLSAQLTKFEEEDLPGDTLIPFRSFPVLVDSFAQSQYDKTYAPLVPFQYAAKGIGIVNFVPDEDGVFRTLPVSYNYHGSIYYTLSYTVFKDLYPQSEVHQFLRSPMQVYWYGKGGPTGVFPYYSIHAVIVSAIKMMRGEQPDIDPKIFAGKVVFIGSNAPGLLDLRTTPFTSEEPYPGVEIHATAYSNLSQQHFVSKIGMWYVFMIALALSLLTSLSVNSIEGIINATTVTILIMIAFIIAVTQAFSSNLWWIESVFPLFSVIFTYVIGVGWNFATEGRTKRQIQRIFGQFVNPHVVRQLSHDPEKVELGGEEVEATILFSDIEGFTSISETKKPKELVAFLNEYFSAANDVFFKFDGTIDKFIGDAVMVQFGIPLKNPQHRLFAVRAAYEFSRHVYAMNAQAREKNEPVFSTRIGINSGQMIVGYIGGRSKKEYTVIGDTVNLASRLEGVNKFYGTSILISESTASQVLDEFVLREMDLIRVKGKHLPIKIYEVVCPKTEATDAVLRKVQSFESALQLYRQQQWRDAISIFHSVLKIDEADIPAKTYIERCINFEKDPPGKDWDGVYTMTTK